VQKSLALGMVRPDLAEVGQRLKISILGRPFDAIVVPESPYDPDNARLKA
jgi:dimethylglycine dehydrogenase